jgi:putative cardiolipin synthase
MSVMRALVAALLALACTACVTLTAGQREHAEAIATAARATALDCQRSDACAQPSSLHDLGTRALADSSAVTAHHFALIIDRGPDAMLARINLIRSATRSIDLQTYIFSEDDAGHLVLDELLAAAHRGVRVRVLIDQLSALERTDTLAALAGAEANFSIRVYNPTFSRAHISYPQYALAAACCWRKLNQRMHTKLLLIDGAVGITGGRNYADDYYDWNSDYNFRDRDVLVAGPVARDMAGNFDAFWTNIRSWPAEQLTDVGRLLLHSGVPPVLHPDFEQPDRVAAMSRDADDASLIRERLTDQALAVGPVTYLADLPQKHGDGPQGPARATTGLRELIDATQHEMLLQTPYLVLSKPAQQLFRALHGRNPPPRVIVSTSSLAGSDSFIVYALSYKYKRSYLRDFGFDIYEYKPFPADAPIDLPIGPTAAAPTAGAAEAAPPSAADERAGVPRRDRGPRALAGEDRALRYFGSRSNARVPLTHAGVRIGLHAKSMVFDDRIGVIGTHNFDPRGDRYNTESAVVIADPAFAALLATSIRRDIAPANSWTIAPRDKLPAFSGIEYSLAKLSERLPLFDLWPVRYATSYEFQPGPQCPAPLSPRDPAFRNCYRGVGDFPEVNLSLKAVMTRIVTAFGAGLAPVL